MSLWPKPPSRAVSSRVLGHVLRSWCSKSFDSKHFVFRSTSQMFPKILLANPKPKNSEKQPQPPELSDYLLGGYHCSRDIMHGHCRICLSATLVTKSPRHSQRNRCAMGKDEPIPCHTKEADHMIQLAERLSPRGNSDL